MAKVTQPPVLRQRLARKYRRPRHFSCLVHRWFRSRGRVDKRTNHLVRHNYWRRQTNSERSWLWHGRDRLAARRQIARKCRARWESSTLDGETGSEMVAMDGGSAWVEQLIWHPCGEWLVSAAGKKLRLWNAKGELLQNYPDQAATIAAVSWLPKGKEFITTCYGGVFFWSPENDSLIRRFEWKGSVLALAVSPDSQFIAGGCQDALVHFWHVKNGKNLEMTGYPQKVKELSWDSSSRFLATGGGEQVTIWDCSGKGPAGSTPISFELHLKPLTALAFQNNGPILASGVR